MAYSQKPYDTTAEAVEAFREDPLTFILGNTLQVHTQWCPDIACFQMAITDNRNGPCSERKVMYTLMGHKVVKDFLCGIIRDMGEKGRVFARPEMEASHG